MKIDKRILDATFHRTDAPDLIEDFRAEFGLAESSHECVGLAMKLTDFRDNSSHVYIVSLHNAMDMVLRLSRAINIVKAEVDRNEQG